MGGAVSLPGPLGDISPSGRYDPGTARFLWKLAVIESWLGCSRGQSVRKWVESESKQQRERDRGLLSSALFGAAGLNLACREAHSRSTKRQQRKWRKK